jgi:hypothetical protein
MVPAALEVTETGPLGVVALTGQPTKKSMLRKDLASGGLKVPAPSVVMALAKRMAQEKSVVNIVDDEDFRRKLKLDC